MSTITKALRERTEAIADDWAEFLTSIYCSIWYEEHAEECNSPDIDIYTKYLKEYRRVYKRAKRKYKKIVYKNSRRQAENELCQLWENKPSYYVNRRTTQYAHKSASVHAQLGYTCWLISMRDEFQGVETSDERRKVLKRCINNYLRLYRIEYIRGLKRARSFAKTDYEQEFPKRCKAENTIVVSIIGIAWVIVALLYLTLAFGIKWF